MPAQGKNLMIRVTNEGKKKIIENSKKFGFFSVSEYLRYVGINTKDIKIIND